MVINLKDIQNSKFNKPVQEIPAGTDISSIGKQSTASTIDIERTVRSKDGSETSTFSISMEVKDASELKQVLEAVGYEKEKTGIVQNLKKLLWRI